MSDNPPRSTARGAYLLKDLDMEKKYRCHRCGQLEIPYMVLVRKNLILPFCSFDCSMVVYIQTDMQPRRDIVFHGTKSKTQLRLVAKQPLNDVAERRDNVNLSRDDYLRNKIQESGVTVAFEEIPDFGTWEGFGFLFWWAYSQSWWEEFATIEHPFGIDEAGSSVPIAWVDPDRFADELFKFL